ncbi:transcriptional adapter 2-alpha-like, partial [Manacus vitellinus]|uniref:transcriptional adapter 2-alpha-like n=1 Tax=Manacus vitellinus TaxID=328815 RepID=UPI00115D31CA
KKQPPPQSTPLTHFCSLGSPPASSWGQTVEFELRREIKRLQEYRAAGITNFCSARTYDHLKKSRDEERLKRTMLSEVLQYIQDSSACQQWLSRQADIDSGLTPTVPVPSTTGRC